MAWTTPANFLTVYATGYGVTPDGTGINREDLSDLIFNQDPFDNILFAMAPKEDSMSTTHEWPIDVLPTASRSGVAEGSDFDAQVLSTPTRLENFTQIFRFDVGVSGTQRAMNPAGIGDVYNYHILQGTHAIAKAVEQRLVDIGIGAGATVSCPGFGGTGVSTNPRRMKPLVSLVDSGNIIDMALATITGDKVDEALETAYGVGCKPEFAIMSHGVKADFTRNVTAGGTFGIRNIASVDKRIVRSIDVYEGDYGVLSILPNRSVPQASGTDDFGYVWLVERSKIAIATLRPIKHFPLAKVGDNTKGMLVGELTVALKHPKGIAAIKRVIT